MCLFSNDQGNQLAIRRPLEMEDNFDIICCCSSLLKWVELMNLNLLIGDDRTSRCKSDRGSCRMLMSFWTTHCRWILAKRCLSEAFHALSKPVTWLTPSVDPIDIEFLLMIFSLHSAASWTGFDNGSSLRRRVLRRNRHRSGIEVSEGRRARGV